MRFFARVMLMAAGLLIMATDGPLIASAQPVRSIYALAPFGQVYVTRPQGEPRGAVLFLSDSNGVTATETAIATELGRRGLLVALVSTPALMKTPDAWSTHCLNANYPLVDLARDIQHREGVKAYIKPVILGEGEGGTLAYASLSQWANGSYLGVVSAGFAPEMTSTRPWCTAPGFSAEPVNGGAAWRFGPNKQIKLPWVALHAPAEAAAVSALVQAVPNARALALPGVTSQWPGPVADAVAAMLPQPPVRAAAGTLPVPDMPLTIVPAQASAANRDVMAIIYSGDGGWVGIDRDVAGELAKAGIPVVGVDSLTYFWTARNPAGAGRDLGQLIESFSQHWQRPRVMLIGYSFGADAMPYMIGQLPASARARIDRVTLLGFSASTDFQFHLSSWLNISSDNSLPTIPAVSRLRGMQILCVRGEEEDDSACGQIPFGIATQYLVPGDHHFDRNSALLAEIILGQRRPGTVSE